MQETHLHLMAVNRQAKEQRRAHSLPETTTKQTSSMKLLMLAIIGLGIPSNGFLVIPNKKAKKIASVFSTQTPLVVEPPPWSSATNVSFVIPRFFPEEVPDGTYPSPMHSIHVRSIMSDDETSKALRLATEYASETGRWDRPDRERHATYATCDFPIEESEDLFNYLEEIDFNGRIWNMLSSLYGVSHDDMSYLDFFCAHYQALSDENPNSMDYLEAHRDGSLLSFSVLLNPPEEFQGGGTLFDALREVDPVTDDDGVLAVGGMVRPNRAGDVVLHSGKMLHGADKVTQGKRTVLVGFVDVGEWRHRPGALFEACRDWGRMDVATHRYKRQKAMTGSDASKVWIPKGIKWLAPVKSSMKSVCPAFRSVEERADPEYQRAMKLQAEDVLLRRILLPEGSSAYSGDIFDGDITIL